MRIILAVTLLVATSLAHDAAEQPSLNQMQLDKELQTIQDEDGDSARLERGRRLVGRHFFSSQQVKAIAMRFRNDEARLEFATAAFPRTIDPENFYEVYDAFSRFSMVFRLHDRVRPVPRGPYSGPYVPQVPVLQAVPERDLKNMVQALRKEPFENSRLQVAKQIVGGSRGNFLSSQVRQLVACFDFEPGKLDLAKFAYDYTMDPENYYQVQEAFSFSNTRQQLAKYIEEKQRSRPRPR